MILGMLVGTLLVVGIWKALSDSDKPSERRDRRLGLAIIFVGLAIGIGLLAMRVVVPGLKAEYICVLHFPMGIAVAASLYQSVLMIVKDLREIFKRQKGGLIMAGLLLFVVTRYIELLYT